MIETLKKYTQHWWFWFVLVFVLYFNTLNHQYVIDDQIVVTNNQLTQQGVSALPEIFSHSFLYGYDGREDESYRPLSLATFAMERTFFEANPFMSHLLQVILYAFTIMILFKWLQLLFEKHNQMIAVIITILFAIHPLHTEVVANVKSRDELLCALLLFLSFYKFTVWLKHDKKLDLVFALSCYFLSLLSKETAVVAVFVFPLIAWFQRDNSIINTFKKSALFFAPFIMYFVIRYTVLANVMIESQIDPVANSLALAENQTDLLASNFSIFAKYFQLIFFPIALSWDYSVAQLPIVSFGNFASMIGLVLMLVLIFLAIYAVLKKSFLGFGAFFFLSTFIITSNFLFLINCPLGERFMFLPILGILIIVVPFVFQINPHSLKVFYLKNVVFYAFLGFFIVQTMQRNMDWKDNLSIYTAGVDTCPKSVKTHFNLGTEYITLSKNTNNEESVKDLLNKAIESFQNAKKVYPKYVNIYENESYAWSELAKFNIDTLSKKECLKKAIHTINFAIDSLSLYKENLFQNQLYNLNTITALERDTILRNQYLNQVLSIVKKKKSYGENDYHQEFYALLSLNKEKELLKLIDAKALEYPNLIALVSDLSKTYFERKNYKTCIELLSIYMKTIPNDYGMMTNLGMMYELDGDKMKAKEIYQNVVQLDSSNVKAKTLLTNLK